MGMRTTWTLALMLATATTAGAEEAKMGGARFIVMDHQDGQLAVARDGIVSIFYGGAAGQPPRLRLNLEGGSNKTVDPPAAEALWKTLHEGPGAEAYVWVEHLGGTLGIPIAGVQSVFRSGGGETVRVRINYPGDPQGKAIEGAEAQRVWEALTR